MMIKVTYKKSAQSCTKRQQETVRGLGLRKLHQSKVLQDTPAIRGIIRKVSHLVDVEEVQG